MDQQLLLQAGEQLSRWQRTLVLAHARPDGDSLGAMGAMTCAIRSTGRQATGLIYEEILSRYRFLRASQDFVVWQPQPAESVDRRFDGILVVDTCSWSQIEPVAEYLRASRLPRLVIDHHATRDDIIGAGASALYVIDPSAASACELVHRLMTVMGWPIDVIAAEALMAGMTTDTGWFRFSNTDGRTLRAAAALLESGLRADHLYSQLYETRAPARLRLKGLVLGTLEFHAGDALTVMSVTKAMIEQAGAAPSDTEDLVNETMEVGKVCVSILLTDLSEGRVRVNFRSKAPEVCGRDVDVAALARQFGGGGHRRAAGAWISAPLVDARRQVIAAVLTLLA